MPVTKCKLSNRKIVNLRNSGTPVKEIARLGGVRPQSIYYHLGRLELRQKTPKAANDNNKISIQKAAELYKVGFTLSQIGKRMGTDPSLLCQNLKKYGVKTRSRAYRFDKEMVRANIKAHQELLNEAKKVLAEI